MKFLVDAQLPRRLAEHLTTAGLSAIHTLDLPAGNRTTDLVINELSIREQYVVVTKDSDFVESFLLSRVPWKLLLITTGNIGNSELDTLFLANVNLVAYSFEAFDFIELNRTSVVFHV